MSPVGRSTPELPDSGGRLATVELFGFDFAAVDLDQAVTAAIGLSTAPVAQLIVTGNVDHVVELAVNERFRSAYALASLRLADGAPVVLASKLAGEPLPCRVTGADLVDPVCRRAADLGLRVAIVGGEPAVNALAVANLELRYPTLRVTGINTPPGLGSDPVSSDKLVEDLADADARVVLFCCGAPRSEIWVAERLGVLAAGVYLCAGAAVDFLAGAKRHAPRWVQRIGAEWLYRLVIEPRRLWRRYLVKDPKFAYLALREIVAKRRAHRRPAPAASSPPATSGTRVGIDLVSVSDVASSLETFGQHYADTVFTPHEQASCVGAADVQARAYAGRFAAKEAVLKTLRPQHSDAIPWTSIEIRKADDGSCSVHLTAEADELAARNNVASVTVSLSHDLNYATAVAIATTQEPHE